MVKTKAFSKFAKKESANVRKCLRDNKLKSNKPKTVEYVSNKKKNNKKFPQKKVDANEIASDDDGNSDSEDSVRVDEEKLPNGRPQPLPKNAKEEFPSFDTMPTAANFVRLYDAGQLSRLMYPNPVCFLTTLDADGSKRNVMTLSWLCPANNYGGFVFVIHKTRFSASNIAHHKAFNLSIANASQLELLSAIGKCTGKGRDKFDGSIANLATVPFGRYSNDQLDEEGSNKNSKLKWEYMPANTKEIQSKASRKSVSINPFGALGDSSDEESENEDVEAINEPEIKEAAADVKVDAAASTASKKSKTLTDPLFIQGSIAHLRCTVVSMADAADAGHYLVVANITEAAVHPQYWTNKGKCLAPVEKELPSIVSFLGSQQFGSTNPL